MNPGHPSFHFGTCYTKLLHQTSFYSPLNSAVFHCFRLSKIVCLCWISCFLVTLDLSNMIKSLFQVFQLSSITTLIPCTTFSILTQCWLSPQNCKLGSLRVWSHSLTRVSCYSHGKENPLLSGQNHVWEDLFCLYLHRFCINRNIIITLTLDDYGRLESIIMQ